MKKEDIAVGGIYYFNNRPVKILNEEADTGFFRVLAFFDISHEVTGSNFCFQCNVGGDYKGAHTCDEASDVIEYIMEEIDDREVFWVSYKYLREKPYELVKYEALQTKVEETQKILEKTRKEAVEYSGKLTHYRIEYKSLLSKYETEESILNKKLKNLYSHHKNLLRRAKEEFTTDVLKLKVNIGSTGKTIGTDDLIDLLKARITLEALEAGGVDNWVWYGESLEDINVEQQAYNEFLNL